MPATSTRTRMPYNNRVSTSGALRTTDIWSRAIGHDPHRNDAEDEGRETSGPSEEHARGLMELVKHQAAARQNEGNDAGGASSFRRVGTDAQEGFSAQMFHGLKKRPQWGNPGDAVAAASIGPEEYGDESSSEDEYIEVKIASSVAGTAARGVTRKIDSDRKRPKKSKKLKKKYRCDSESDSGGRKRDRGRRYRRSSKRSKSRSRSNSVSSSSSEDYRKRRDRKRSHDRQKRERRKHSDDKDEKRRHKS